MLIYNIVGECVFQIGCFYRDRVFCLFAVPWEKYADTDFVIFLYRDNGFHIIPLRLLPQTKVCGVLQAPSSRSILLQSYLCFWQGCGMSRTAHRLMKRGLLAYNLLYDLIGY